MSTNRNIIEQQILEFCQNKAKLLGCDIINRKEDTEQGMWGKGMANLLVAKYGKGAIDEVSYTNNDGDTKVWMRHRFGNPCVGISLKDRRVLAEMELSDYDYEAKSSGSGKFFIGQFTIFSEEGLVLADELRDLWKNKIEPMLNQS